MNELVRDLDPRYVPIKFDHDRRRIAPGRAVTGLCPQTDRRTDGRTDRQTDNLNPVYPPFNFVERGYNDTAIRPILTATVGAVISSAQRTMEKAVDTYMITVRASLLSGFVIENTPVGGNNRKDLILVPCIVSQAKPTLGLDKIRCLFEQSLKDTTGVNHVQFSLFKMIKRHLISKVYNFDQYQETYAYFMGYNVYPYYLT